MKERKIIAFAVAFMLACVMLTPAACAAGLVIPDITEVYESAELRAEDGNMRAYDVETVEQAAECAALYIDALTEYGFGSFETDSETIDSILLIYIDEYSGDADIESGDIGGAKPCFVLMGLGAYDGGVLILLKTTDGITVGSDRSDAVVSNAAAYVPPVADDDGLLVMPIDEYLDGLTLSCATRESGSNHYGYHYLGQGRYYGGGGSDEYRAMYERYVNDLVATGYYTLLEHSEDSLSETWRLGYTGDAALETFTVWRDQADDAVIVVDLLFDDANVYYSADILTTNYSQVVKSNDANGGAADDRGEIDTSMTCPRCHGYGTQQCTLCWGSGQVSDDSMSTGRSTCPRCRGRGYETCDYCDGNGTIN